MRRNLGTLALALALLAPPVSAQVDTASVTIYDVRELRVQISPCADPCRGFANFPDTVQFTALVTDTLSGDTIQATNLLLKWRLVSGNPNQVQLDSLTGVAVITGRATFRVTVDLEVTQFIALYEMAGDDGTFINMRDIRAGQTVMAGYGARYLPPGHQWLEICAYGITTTGLVAERSRRETFEVLSRDPLTIVDRGTDGRMCPDFLPDLPRYSISLREFMDLEWGVG